MPISEIVKTCSQVKIGPDGPVVYAEFPKMIYHVIKKPEIVHTQEELDVLLAAGWSTTPVKMNELAILDTKIAETEEELRKMRQARTKLVAQKKAEKKAEERSA